MASAGVVAGCADCELKLCFIWRACEVVNHDKLQQQQQQHHSACIPAPSALLLIIHHQLDLLSEFATEGAIKPARCTSAAIPTARACAAVMSQVDIMRGRGELRATTTGWNSGVYWIQVFISHC